MKSKRRVIQTQHTEPDYPTLQSHLANRRRFLAVAGASVAASAVAAACNRAMGTGPADAGTDPDPDAAPPQPDADIELLGAEPYPDYYTVRLPGTGELSAYLVDGGYASFYAVAVTYVTDSYHVLIDDLPGAQDVVRSTLAEHTYDSLNTAQGVTGAESDIRDALDAHCQTEHGQPATIEAVTLYISYLSPIVDIDGDMPFPSYP